MVADKFRAIRQIIGAGHIYLLTQKHSGEQVAVAGAGLGDIQDMLLMARAMKLSYDHFMIAIQDLAADTGELHLLQELRDIIDKVEGHDGGNA